MSDDPFAPVDGAGVRGGANAKPKWISVLPVPPDAPPPPGEHPTLGKPSAKWRYRNANGAVLGYTLRFDATDNSKQFRPLTFWRSAAGDKAEWRWESWPPNRPLYGLERLAERPSRPVVVCEGEKAADAATRLLPSFVAVTSPNGSKSAVKADWSPLKGRSVTVWPDADAVGLDYARQVARLAVAAGACAVAIVSPPADVKVGWDAADALAEAWTPRRAAELIAAAVPADHIVNNKITAANRHEISEHDATPHGRRRTPQRDVLIGLTEFVELWHDANRTAYASFPVNDHCETWPVRSRDFRMWLSGRFFEETGGAIGGQALEDGLRILEARAVNNGPLYECFNRVGAARGKRYLDLGDPNWRAVEITAVGWTVVDKAPIKFLRSPSMRTLPVPEAGCLIEEFRHFVNVKSDDDFILVVAWLVAALRERGPFPILVASGEAGSGKSVFSRMLRSLVDPSAAPIRAVPRDDRDLVVSASNSWLLAFDNLSSVPAWLADALCRLATGSGFATRMLHTDRDEMIFEAARPVIINGIAQLTDRADLADRSVTVHLSAIPEADRRPEDELLAEFENARPRILGALLDAVSRALANMPTVKLDRAPRMADFAKWIIAAEPGLGWRPGAFLAAYGGNRRDVAEAAFEADAIAVAIDKFMTTDRPEGFEGTPTELFDALNARATEAVRKSKFWPQSAAQLGNRLARATPLLRAKGYIVERRHSGARIITIVPPRTG
jgi:putative DNA primase/helicase